MDVQEVYHFEILDPEYLTSTKAKKKSKKQNANSTFKKLKDGHLQIIQP